MLCLPKSYYDHFGPLALCQVIKADFLFAHKNKLRAIFREYMAKGGEGGDGTDAGFIIKKKRRSKKIFPAGFLEQLRASIRLARRILFLTSAKKKKTAFRQREPLIYEGRIRCLARKPTAFCFTPGPFRGMDGQVKSRRHCLASPSAHLATK